MVENTTLGTTPDATSTTYTLTVNDVNEAPTAVTLASATASIAENSSTAAHIKVADIVVTDDALGTDTLGLTGADAAFFEIAGTSLFLKAGTVLNFEAKASYAVAVTVDDTSVGGTPDATSATYTLAVTNVNEPPVITSNGGGTTATVSVVENTTAVTTVAATDPDASTTLTYSITGGSDAGQFTINPTTGALSFVSAPQFATPTDSDHNNSYVVIVQASDGGLTDIQTITVNVTNTNHAPTGATVSANTVAENSANGTVIGAVSGQDPDAGDALSYSLQNNAGGRFAINATTGQITVANGSLLDYESATSHAITVRVTDQGGLFTDVSFTVNVTNVNEAPVITSNGGGTTATTSLAENTTAVTTVGATDPDAGTTLAYSVTGGSDAGQFTINPITGALSFVSAPHFATPTDSDHNNSYI